MTMYDVTQQPSEPFSITIIMYGLLWHSSGTVLHDHNLEWFGMTFIWYVLILPSSVAC